MTSYKFRPGDRVVIHVPRHRKNQGMDEWEGVTGVIIEKAQYEPRVQFDRALPWWTHQNWAAIRNDPGDQWVFIATPDTPFHKSLREYLDKELSCSE